MGVSSLSDVLGLPSLRVNLMEILGGRGHFFGRELLRMELVWPTGGAELTDLLLNSQICQFTDLAIF